VSGEYVKVLKRRARSFLAEAESAADPDLGMFFLEQAAQLYIKAVYYEVFGETIRVHGLRELLGLLAHSLKKHGYDKEAEKITDFTSRNRGILIVLEDAYITGRYGELGYSINDVEEALPVVKRLSL